MKKLFSAMIGLGAAAAGVAYFFKKYNDYYEKREKESLPEELVLSHHEASSETDEETALEEAEAEADQEADYLNLDEVVVDYSGDDRMLKTAIDSEVTPLDSAVSDSIIAISHYTAEQLVLKHQLIYFDQDLQNNFLEEYKNLSYDILIFQDTITISKTFENDLTLIKAELTKLYERLFHDFAVYKGLEVIEL